MSRMVDLHLAIGEGVLARGAHAKHALEIHAKTFQRAKVHVIPTNTVQIVDDHLLALRASEMLLAGQNETVGRRLRHFCWPN